jgi:hypothetical protein
MPFCKGRTTKKTSCMNWAIKNGYCHLHQDQFDLVVVYADPRVTTSEFKIVLEEFKRLPVTALGIGLAAINCDNPNMIELISDKHPRNTQEIMFKTTDNSNSSQLHSISIKTLESTLNTLIKNDNKQCNTHVLKLDLTTLFWQRACLVHESALAVSAPTYTTFGKKSCIVYHPCTTNMHSYKGYFYLYMLFDIRIKA